MWIRWKLEMLFRGFSKSNINQVLVDRLKHWVMDGRFHFQSWRINLYQFVAGAEVWATEPTALWNPVTPEIIWNDKLKFLEFLYFSISRPGWCIWLPGLSCCIIASMIVEFHPGSKACWSRILVELSTEQMVSLAGNANGANGKG